jgi:hypothetical protein
VPAGGVTIRSRAASGIMPTGTTAGLWGASTGLGQAGTGNARLANAVVAAASQEAWPEAEPNGPEAPRQEPWWNADRRPLSVPSFVLTVRMIASETSVATTPAHDRGTVSGSCLGRFGGGRRIRRCGSFSMRLSAFRFPSFFRRSPD